MSQNNEDKAIYPATSIRTTDGKGQISVDHVRELFINNDHTLEELSVQLNLPLAHVEHASRQGMKSWYQLKQDHLAQRMKHFMDLNIDNLMETHSVLEDGHFLTLAQMKGTQAFLKSYLMEKGHLFRVDEDGEISLDSYGIPIPMTLPNGPKHFMALESFLKLKEGTKQAMRQVQELNKELEKRKIIDITDTGIFDESPE